MEGAPRSVTSRIISGHCDSTHYPDRPRCFTAMTTEPRFPRVVDDVTVRLIASVVLILALVALDLHQWWVYVVLAVDFILRTTLGPKASLLAMASSDSSVRWSARPDDQPRVRPSVSPQGLGPH